MNCQQVTEQYRNLVALMPLDKFPEVERWELVLYEHDSLISTVGLVGHLPLDFCGKKDEISQSVRQMKHLVQGWNGEIGPPVVDVHTPNDNRTTHSPHATYIPLQVNG